MNCSLIFVNPQPQFKSGEDVHFHTGTEVAADPDFRADKKAVYHDGLTTLSRLRAGKGRILDIGCGFGLFLREAQHFGWEPFGVDVSAVSVGYARSELGLTNVIRGELLTLGLPEAHFRAATLWNLLEHVPDPLATMQEVRRILTADGIALIRVPNMLVHNLLWWGRPLLRPALRAVGLSPPPYLGGISPPHHLYGFTPCTMKVLLRRAGFEPVDIVPAVSHHGMSTMGRLARIIGSVAYTVSGNRLVLTPAFVAYAHVSTKTLPTSAGR
jgi:SAM-dependent methyltransferase